ncbi:LuxR C-terminal-related transcriptional regulator [Kitasatospora sp. NPDC050463]|uniref:response regulator transcription factor n=1 Tax=Kitasatospora sp. NPDC050463 TaxID=3155786 RepID=UPI0033FC95F6
MLEERRQGLGLARPAPPRPGDDDDPAPREREVLGLLGVGLSNKEIADRLHLGVTTVKTHVASLMAKTGRDNRIRLAVLAVLTGITPD